jgi:DNA-3-methyladenine glycosylase I
MTELRRCHWVNQDPLYLCYHDKEWGVPIYDAHKLFEFLVLEGMQAGLSWLTILKRRNNYLQAFDNMDPHKIAAYTQQDMDRLLADPGIIRHAGKVKAIITNAQAYLRLTEQHGDFASFIWQFVNGQPIQNHWRSAADVPTQTPQSILLAKVLKQHDFSFVGSTICYAFMQAVGMVNDHTVTCFRHADLSVNANGQLIC